MNGKVFPKWCLWILVISCVMLLVSGSMLTAQEKPPSAPGAEKLPDSQWLKRPNGEE